jgi:hypothetical protein
MKLNEGLDEGFNLFFTLNISTGLAALIVSLSPGWT